MENPFGKIEEEKVEENIVEEHKEEIRIAPVPQNKTVIKSRKQIILEKHGGLESNVPVTSPYWKMKN